MCVVDVGFANASVFALLSKLGGGPECLDPGASDAGDIVGDAFQVLARDITVGADAIPEAGFGAAFEDIGELVDTETIQLDFRAEAVFRTSLLGRP